MKTKNFSHLVYFIAITIAITLAIQLYWNLEHYKTNKQRLINEVQISLDNSVEAYYANLAKNDIFTFIDMSTTDTSKTENKSFWKTLKSDTSFIDIAIDSAHFKTNVRGFTHILDSSKNISKIRSSLSSISVLQGKNAIDSAHNLKKLASKLVLSFTKDSINYKKLDTLLIQELKRKRIDIAYRLHHFKFDSLIGQMGTSANEDLPLSSFSKSTYLPKNEKMALAFSNPTLTILKRGATGILFSFLLSACIISCLLYLLKIIKKQKALAEIKNDLISNITHEFKTPIATIATAIEGIQHFNVPNDPKKTSKYLEISNEQLKKLHQMVEKLLETATLDSDKLVLKKETVDIHQLLENLAQKHQLLAPAKSIVFRSSVAQLELQIDPFHFENAIANLIDNAIKHGGNHIEINLNTLLGAIEITVADNGLGIDKNQADKIFDKFYRVPTGNRHDVKGFGIGLFYAKKIVEKHQGNLQLIPQKNTTIFKVSL